MIPAERKKTPMKLLLENIDEDGGPLCRHLSTDEAISPYDATSRKLFKFLRQRT
jgi:hypothetical protein